MTSTGVSESITRKSASNLALAFVMLPPDRRHDMAVLYAFCRQVDDVADEETCSIEERRRQLARWRSDVRRACDGEQPELPVIRELRGVIHRRRLPFELFDELILGCEMDLDTNRYETLEELERYCYRVASVVGLLSIEVFGYTNPACREYAIALGKALQFTNILRDVGNDAERGRIYIPLAELRRHGVNEQDILARRKTPDFENVGAWMAARARGFYEQAKRLLPLEDRPNMGAAELMASVYWRLLLRIERRRFDVLDSSPIRLSRLHKLALILGFRLRRLIGKNDSAYGQD